MERVTQHRLDELAQIKEYVEHTGCLMEFLSRALDDPTAAPCGKCMNCTGKTQRNSPPQELVQAAVNFLRKDTLILEPRLKWPKPVLDEIAKAWPAAIERFDNGNPKAMMPKSLCAQEGRALCVYGDAGWGEAVAHGKYEVGSFSDTLVTASADLIQRKWKPTPSPEWVTAIPSQRHSELVREFAERLAAILGLPFLPVLRKRGQTPAQKEMQNSPMQVRNLLRAFDVVAAQNVPKGSKIPSGPVLLVDDVVDSRWTLTWAAVLLRQHGSGPVYPFALAKASLRGG
jgi:ATP-dependent DNA helicase RecQ